MLALTRSLVAVLVLLTCSLPRFTCSSIGQSEPLSHSRRGTASLRSRCDVHLRHTQRALTLTLQRLGRRRSRMLPRWVVDAGSADGDAKRRSDHDFDAENWSGDSITVLVPAASFKKFHCVCNGDIMKFYLLDS